MVGLRTETPAAPDCRGPRSPRSRRSAATKAVEPQLAAGDTGEQILLKVMSELVATLWSPSLSDAVAPCRDRWPTFGERRRWAFWLRYH